MAGDNANTECGIWQLVALHSLLASGQAYARDVP